MLNLIGLKTDPIATAGAGYKIADNIFCVPQVSLNTYR